MLSNSGIAIFLVPLTFYLIEWLASRKEKSEPAAAGAPACRLT